MARGRKKAETQDTGAQLGIEAELLRPQTSCVAIWSPRITSMWLSG